MTYQSLSLGRPRRPNEKSNPIPSRSGKDKSLKPYIATPHVFGRPPVLYARPDNRRSLTPDDRTGLILVKRPPMRTFLTALAFVIVVWFVAALAFSSNASAQETTVTFDATMAGPTTAATTMTPTTTNSTTPESRPSTSPSTSPSGSTDDSTYTSTTVYPTRGQGTSPSTTGANPIGPSTTASTVFQPAATTPINATTPYAGTTSVGYPSMSGGQLMSTGGFELRSVLIGTALSLMAGGSMLYAAYKARRRAGGRS